MQENRSFDNYFGTFPGANGFPQGTCVPLDPAHPDQGCTSPFHDPHDRNAGGSHTSAAAQADLDDGITTAKMDGFVYQQTLGMQHGQLAERDGKLTLRPYRLGVQRHDVMGYHTDAELPNYWAYAKHFVLQDAMFEGVRSWSRPSHVGLVSEWVALCQKGVLSTCVTAPDSRGATEKIAPYPWVNLAQLLDTNNVSWKYYLAAGQEPDCDDDEMTCDPQVQTSGVLSIWNPTPGFAWVRAQGEAYLKAHNPDADQFLVDVESGTLPQVSWIVPSLPFSEHPAAGITAGMEYVTSLVNAVMQSPYWMNTAIFLSYDDWGGFYDHVVPPIVDYNNTATPVQGYGIRVPGLLISAWAKPGFIDHGVLSSDSYARFIEDTFLNGKRLDPDRMGQPDNRPDVRDALKTVVYPDGSTAPTGDLRKEFDFTQTPLPPLILSTHIPTGLAVHCKGAPDDPDSCTTNRVKLNWQAVTGPQVPGPFTYQVLRDGAVVPSCTTAGTACYDDKVPSGAHIYTIYSIDQNNVSSPQSAGAEADVP